MFYKEIRYLIEDKQLKRMIAIYLLRGVETITDEMKAICKLK